MTTDQLIDAIGLVDEAMVQQARELPPVRTVRRRRSLRTALIAAVIVALFTVTAYAVNGTVSFTGTSLKAGTFPQHQTIRYLPRAEKLLGVKLAVPERFSNGYEFVDMGVHGEEAVDADYNTLQVWRTLEAHYAKPGSEDLILSVHPVLGLPSSGEAREPTASSERLGVTMSYNAQAYKAVPEDYELTPEDEAREAAGELTISWGSDRVQTFEVCSVDFTAEDAEYVLLLFDHMEAEELFAMAEELLAQPN